MPEFGDFEDNHNYFDLIFRLLREDAVKPLRDGV
jgi:hypothetical protein